MTSWDPANSIIAELSSSPSLEDLNVLIAASLELAARIDCPCPSTLHLMASTLTRLHTFLDNGDGITEEKLVAMNNMTSFLSQVLRVAGAEGDAKEWASLAHLWSKLRTPEIMH